MCVWCVQVLAPASGVGHGEVGVFGIAQCYDKKLEASRQVRGGSDSEKRRKE